MASLTSTHPPFFIVGNDRSGTTMLRLILDRGDCAVPTESMFLIDFAAVRRDPAGLSTPERAAEFAARVWRHPKVRDWGLAPSGPDVEACDGDPASAYRRAVEAPYLAYMARERKYRWGDKTPAYLAHLRELKAVFPDAQIVEIVRDGRDVALSVMKLPFGANNIYAAAMDWAEGVRLGQVAEKEFASDFIRVRYEQLVSEPAETVQRICTFLDLPYDQQMLRIDESSHDKVVAGQADWFTNLWSGINVNSVGKWKQEMSAKELNIFMCAAGDELRELGYVDVAPCSEGAGTKWHKAGWLLADRAQRYANAVRLRLVQERGRELRYVLQRKLSR